MQDNAELLNSYWPLLFVLGALLPLLILVAAAAVTFLIARYLGPDVKEFFKSGVEANQKTAVAVTEQGPLLKDTNVRVVKIADVQGLAHTATHDSLQVSILNQKSLARGLIEGMQAFEAWQPELHGQFKPAIDALREIETRVMA